MATTSPRRADAEAKAAAKPSTEPSRSMRYSAECMDTIGWLSRRLGRMLMRNALARAQSDGRTTVTEDDVFAALDQLGLSNVYPVDGDEDDDAEG